MLQTEKKKLSNLMNFLGGFNDFFIFALAAVPQSKWYSQ